MIFLKRMYRKNLGITTVAACLIHLALWSWAAGFAYGEVPLKSGQIQRLTYSKDDSVLYPSMDAQGKAVVYRQETVGPEGEKTASIRVVRVGDRSTRVLFSDRTLKAPAPHEDQFLRCGTKPPVISGDGTKVAFSLSLGSPLFMEDHYLAVANSDGSDLRVISLRNEELARHEWGKRGFAGDTWRNISQYQINNKGKEIACLVKGHLGAKDILMPSGIVLVNSDGSGQRTLMAPKLGKEGWVWKGYPRRPSTGGGWVFDTSGDGKKVLFGGQSSGEKTDYDLYVMDTDGKEIRKITDFEDRWFVRGDISDRGQTICFFYSGKKLEGIGTYVLGFGRDGLRRLRSQITDRVDFQEMSGHGGSIVHRVSGRGLAFIDANGVEFLIFDERGEGFRGIKGGLDFPYFPSFWSPSFLSLKGDRILLEAIPTGKDRREFFLLRLD